MQESIPFCRDHLAPDTSFDSWVLLGLMSFKSPAIASERARSPCRATRRFTVFSRTPPLSRRCCLVFAEPAEILVCLEAIAADKEVEVIRVNNRLAPNYDAGLSAGYR